MSLWLGNAAATHREKTPLVGRRRRLLRCSRFPAAPPPCGFLLAPSAGPRAPGARAVSEPSARGRLGRRCRHRWGLQRPLGRPSPPPRARASGFRPPLRADRISPALPALGHRNRSPLRPPFVCALRAQRAGNPRCGRRKSSPRRGLQSSPLLLFSSSPLLLLSSSSPPPPMIRRRKSTPGHPSS